MNGMVFSCSKRRMMLQLMLRSIFCKFDSNWSAVHELPVAVYIFRFGCSTSWTASVFGFFVADFDEKSPISVDFDEDTPSLMSLDDATNFARFCADSLVLVAFARFRSFWIFVYGQPISFLSSEDIVPIFVFFSNFVFLFGGSAAARLLTAFFCETLQTKIQINE